MAPEARSDDQPRARTTLDPVLLLLGIPVSDDDARWLIAAQYRKAHASAIAACLMIGTVSSGRVLSRG